MKKRTNRSKLSLTRQTVRRLLSKNELGRVAGGEEEGTNGYTLYCSVIQNQCTGEL